jgi:hypothetical protein
LSIATDARAYADAALEQGKSVLSQATNAVNAATDRVVELVEEEAPKSAFAVVGAADLAVETVTKRVEAFPSETAINVAKAQESSKALLSKAQTEALNRLYELKAKIDAGLESARGLRSVNVSDAAKGASDLYVSTARNMYETLTARGEARVAELRKDPRFAKFLDDVNDAAESVQSTLSPVVDSVQSTLSPVVDSVQSTLSPVVDSVHARVAPVVDSLQSRVEPVFGIVTDTVKSVAPSRKPVVKSAPVRRAPAKKSPAVKATTTKAPAAKVTTPKVADTTTAAPKTAAVTKQPVIAAVAPKVTVTETAPQAATLNTKTTPSV